MYDSSLEQHQNIFSNILVWGLIIGTYISNIPQYYRLYKRKNVLGISEQMLIFGICSCILSVMGTFMKNKTDINNKCGSSKYDCYILITGLLQLLGPYICAHIFYVMYYYYFKKQVLILINHELPKIKEVKRRFYIVFIFTGFIIIYSIINFFLTSQKVNDINNEVFNITSCLFSIIMWLPQIYETYKIKGNYSLSILALTIHCLGCILTIIFQFFLNHQNIFVVLPYIIGAILEFIVIVLCSYYQCKGKDDNLSLYQNLIN